MRLEPTLILHNGRIWTGDESNPWAESIAIANSSIVMVDSNQAVTEAYGAACPRLDLGGKLCLPGLWDAHIHFYYWSLGLRQVSLVGCHSLEEMLSRIQLNLGEHTGNAWSTGWGWNETFWSDPVLPTRHDLDAVTGMERPALFYRSDMHSAVANTAALSLAGLMEAETEVEGGVVERDEDGLPTGLLRELAINLVRNHVPSPTGQCTDEALIQGISELHKLGITGICDQRMKDQEDGPKALAAFARLNRRRQLKLRVSCNVAAHNLPLIEALGVSANMGDEHLRLGHIKIFADGTLGSRTAKMLEPFLTDKLENLDNRGMMLTPAEQIASELRRAVDMGFPVSIHAIGDEANRLCLDIFQGLRDLGLETPVIPHRIEHVQFLDDEDSSRLVDLGVTASMQPAHVLDDMDTADLYLGERSRLAYRFATLLKNGANLAFGSDAPVSDVNPFYGIHGAIARQRPDRMECGPWHPEELLSLHDTLRAYTLGAAKASGWDRLTGSLQPGKRADLCLLDRDIFQLHEAGLKGDEVADTKVLLTMLEGEIVWRSESF